MNSEKIERLEAGPELDRLVAEMVMGWREGTDYIVGEARLLREVTETVGALQHRKTVVWSPSTDIAAAWEVVEWLLSRGFFLDIFSPRAKDAPEWVDHPDKWSVFVCTWEREDGIVYFFQSHILSKADTLSLAICRAALAWVMRGEK